MGPDDARRASTEIRSLQTIAAFEALKGVLVLLLGFGLLAFIHRDLHETAETLIARLHVDPERPYARAFLHAAGNLTDGRLLLIALGGVMYSIVRFLEAWGLWLNRTWAQYFGILSGALYLPWEAYEVVRRPTRIHFFLLIANVVVVLVLVVIRVRHSDQWLSD